MLEHGAVGIAVDFLDVDRFLGAVREDGVRHVLGFADDTTGTYNNDDNGGANADASIEVVKTGNGTLGKVKYGYTGADSTIHPTNTAAATAANGKTTFLFYNADNNSVSVYKGIANAPTFTALQDQDVTVAVYSDSTAATFHAKIFFGVVEAGKSTLSASSKEVIFVKGNSDGVSHTDELGDFYSYDAIINGEITTIRTSQPITGGMIASAASKSDKGVYSFDKAYATGEKTMVLDANNTVTTSSGNATGKVYYTTKTDANSNGTITLGGTGITVADDCKVFRISADGKTIYASTVASIQKDDNDQVWYKVTDGEVTTIVIKIVDDLAAVSSALSDDVVVKAVDFGVTNATAVTIQYYIESGTRALSTSDKRAVLADNGCSNISVSGANWTFTKDGIEQTLTINPVQLYKLTVDDNAPLYVKTGTVSLAKGSNGVAGDAAGTGFIVSTNGGTTFTYSGAYGNYTMTAFDTVVKTGYNSFTAPSSKTQGAMTYSLTAPTTNYVKAGEAVTLTLKAVGTGDGGTAVKLTVTAGGTLTAVADLKAVATGTTTGLTSVGGTTSVVTFTPAASGDVDATINVTLTTNNANATFTLNT